MAWLAEFIPAAVTALLICAALSDVATRVIPDSITVALALLGLVGRASAGLSGLAVSVALALLLFILLAALYARGLMGGGDVKLAAATALGLSPYSQYRFVVVTTLAGGVLALLHLVLRRALRGARTPPPPRGAAILYRILAAERWRIARRGSLPYGVAVACGGIWAALASPLGAAAQ